MNKSTKLIIAFIGSILGSLLLPVFTQWYEQQTGINAYWILFCLHIW
jgi:hypothetical protein